MGLGSPVSLSRYQDVRLVSASDVAELYSAIDPLLRRRVAIKVLSERLAADAATAKRFARKALAAARLSGEQQVVTIYEVGETAGRPFVVMEFLTGGSLEDVLRKDGVQAPRRAIPWLKQVARALDLAHEEGLVHGDVKPSNLLFDEDGRLQVTDFGLVEAVGPSVLPVMEAPGDTSVGIGSSYRAPEQAQGLAAGPAADQYALAAIGFELLTGSRPLEEWPVTEAAAQRARFSKIRRSGYRLPMAAGPVFDRALATRPGDRFESCSRFATALAGALADEEWATTVLTAPSAAAHRRRVWQTRVQPLVGLLLLIAGGAAAAIAATYHRHPKATGVAAITLSRPGATVHETVTAEAPAVTVHDTVTVQAPAFRGTTVLETVTARARTSTMEAPAVTTTSATAAPATATPTAGQSSTSLALAGYRRLQQGDATGALPFLRAAGARLDGTRTLDEAYNDYNLALAITKTEGCGARVSQLLDESESIQGHRSEIDHLRQVCRGRA